MPIKNHIFTAKKDLIVHNINIIIINIYMLNLILPLPQVLFRFVVSNQYYGLFRTQIDVMVSSIPFKIFPQKNCKAYILLFISPDLILSETEPFMLHNLTLSSQLFNQPSALVPPLSSVNIVKRPG